MQLHLVAVPNAKTSEIVGWEDDPRAGRMLRVKIAARRSMERRMRPAAGFLRSTSGSTEINGHAGEGRQLADQLFSLPDGSVLKP